MSRYGITTNCNSEYYAQYQEMGCNSLYPNFKLTTYIFVTKFSAVNCWVEKLFKVCFRMRLIANKFSFVLVIEEKKNSYIAKQG